MQIAIQVVGGKNLSKQVIRGVSNAVNGAFLEAAQNIQKKGRADIAGSWPGMSKRMANAWRADKYPKGNQDATLEPTVKAYHKASYSKVFEAGRETKIEHKRGKWLWLPFKDGPAGKLMAGGGGKRGGAGGPQYLSPAALSFKLGLPLIPIIRPGKTPLLAIKNARVSKSGRFSKTRGASGAGKIKESALIPVFFGIEETAIIGRWNVKRISDSEMTDAWSSVAKRY